VVGVFGRTYKSDVDDVRDSPSVRLIEEFETKGARVLSYDPFIQGFNTLEDVLGCEIVVLAVNHSSFKKIDAGMLRRAKLVYDVWGQFSELDLPLHGIIYISLGRGLWNPQESKMVRY
jgi:UDP-N-acetyl-D-mannosaminuronate dehydrogenase